MPLLAKDLQEELKPLVEGEKSLTLKIIPGHRPEIAFTGMWTGKYIKAAMDSIAKAYRIERRRIILPIPKVAETITQPLAEGGK